METNTIHLHSVKGMHSAEELPRQLVIRNGQIVTHDGTPARFDLPDGTEINVVPRSQLVRFIQPRIEERLGREAMLAPGVTVQKIGPTPRKPRSRAKKKKPSA